MVDEGYPVHIQRKQGQPNRSVLDWRGGILKHFVELLENLST
jgi:hypothetical protein